VSLASQETGYTIMRDTANIPNESDLELLSAYLDGELADPDRAALERRLASDATLRAELESLRQTIGLLHGLPRLHAPRDFTLDPAVYGRRPMWWKRALTSPVLLQASGALGAAASVILIAVGLLSANPSAQDAHLSAPRDEVASYVTAAPSVTVSPVISNPTLNTEGFARLSATPTLPATEARGDFGQSTNTNQPTVVEQMPVPSGEVQLFGEEAANQTGGAPGAQPMLGAVVPSAQATALPAAVAPPQPDAMLEMQAAAPPASLGSESESSTWSEEGAISDGTANTMDAGVSGAAVPGVMADAAMPAATATLVPAEKDLAATPTRALLATPSVTAAALPSPAATVQMQQRALSDRGIPRELPGLAIIGIASLVLSLGIGWIGWKRGHS